MRHITVTIVVLVVFLVALTACSTGESERIAALEATIAAMSQERQEQASAPVQEPYPTSTPYPPPTPLPTYTLVPIPTPFRPTDIPGAYNYRDVPRPPSGTICEQTPLATVGGVYGGAGIVSRTCYLVPADVASYDDLVTWALQTIPGYGWRHKATGDQFDDMIRFEYEPLEPRSVYEDMIIEITRSPGMDMNADSCTYCPPPADCYQVGYLINLEEEDRSILEEY